MKITITKRKIFIIITLTLLLVLSLAAGIYLLVKPNLFDKSYKVDKYSDTINWCNANLDVDTLNINCKGLLLDIRNLEDGNSCFDVQILTKDKKLKDLTICEKGSTFTYTNEILGYKKLMPVDIIFTYTKKVILNDYSFSNVSFTELDDTYVQSIINDDITNLVKIDPASTTIQNSVDFCPKPETLPSYITEGNKAKYEEYFNNNILGKDKYTDSYFYSWSGDAEGGIIRILFACDSANNMEYPGICNLLKLQKVNLLPKVINHIAVVPQWNTDSSSNEEALLKEISLIYDSIYLNKQQNEDINLSLLDTFINKINSMSISEAVFCGMYKIYNSLETINKGFSIDKAFIENTLINNLSKIASPVCSDIIENKYSDISQEGLYLQNSFSIQNTKYEIFNRCYNLTNIIK